MRHSSNNSNGNGSSAVQSSVVKKLNSSSQIKYRKSPTMRLKVCIRAHIYSYDLYIYLYIYLYMSV